MTCESCSNYDIVEVDFPNFITLACKDCGKHTTFKGLRIESSQKTVTTVTNGWNVDSGKIVHTNKFRVVGD